MHTPLLSYHQYLILEFASCAFYFDRFFSTVLYIYVGEVFEDSFVVPWKDIRTPAFATMSPIDDTGRISKQAFVVSIYMHYFAKKLLIIEGVNNPPLRPCPDQRLCSFLHPYSCAKTGLN